MKLLKALLSSSTDASSKRWNCIVLVIVFIIVTFLLMYIPVQIANTDLLKTQLMNLFWLIVLFGGLIAGEYVAKIFGRVKIEQAKKEGPDTVVTQKVDTQNVNTESANIAVSDPGKSVPE